MQAIPNSLFLQSFLKLTENNNLSLDDSLHNWLPSYPNIDPDITIRQLLNHTSGVQDPIFLFSLEGYDNEQPLRIFTPQEVLARVELRFSLQAPAGVIQTSIISWQE